MKLVVDAAITAAYPALRIGIVTGTAIDNVGGHADLDARKERAASDVAGRIDAILAGPEVEAWREAYRSFGVKPRNHRPTAEGFLRRVAKTGQFPTLSKAVDSYLLTETEWYLPVGGYDLDRVRGDISLRHSPGGEKFRAIGSENDEETDAGEVVYADAAQILTRRWNYRDCDECKITESTTRLALFVEAPYPTVSDDSIHGTAEGIAENLERYCGGHYTIQYVTAADGPEFVMT